ncbi:MAG TPA: amino acid adenylation domain-containing protein [Streptosporangiaceae bacterium]
MSAPTLYEWFARSAERMPEAIALEVAGERFSYGELRDRAEAVATTLVAAHGGPPRRVALLASRSVVAFTGYLAALRLGAVVVPVNPGHPAYRNELICAAFRCEVLVVDDLGAAQAAGLGAHVDTVVRLSDADVLAAGGGDVLAAGGRALPDLTTTRDDVAYVLFTSGSTGQPKGVPITHGNLASYVDRNIARFGVGPGSRVSHTFDLTFDPSVFDLFVTWGGGGTLVCPNRVDLLTPVDYLVAGRITHWFSVPSIVSVSANLGNLPTGLPTVLRHSIFIGEQLTYGQAAAWHAVAPQARIDNVYGPTELTVACTEYRLPADPARWPATSNDTVPIGPVYDNLEYVIVDEDGRPAAAGELCVRGPQRFGGYLDAEHNRGRFLCRDGDRFRPCQGTAPEPAHYYRTGDRVRWENGELVHLSRLDHQLKISGYRVELGEIEAAVARHPDVAQAVVIAVSGSTGDGSTGDGVELIGFYTGTQVPERQLQRWLRDFLPIHMVPKRLRHLTELPLNANGKVDRPALRASVLSERR